MDTNLKMVKRALKDASPILFAYFPIAVTFGVIATGSGLSFLEVFLISAFVYAGGAQFMMVSFIATGDSFFATILTTLLVNLRHVLYGTTLGPAFSSWKEGRKWAFAFGMTDEVFAVASSRMLQNPAVPIYQLPFAGACYFSWLLGTVAGAGIGGIVPAQLSAALSFALPALFLALVFLGKRTFAHFSAALCGAALAILATLFHIGSFGIVLGAVTGATLGFVIQLHRSRTAQNTRTVQSGTPFGE